MLCVVVPCLVVGWLMVLLFICMCYWFLLSSFVVVARLCCSMFVGDRSSLLLVD